MILQQLIEVSYKYAIVFDVRGTRCSFIATISFRCKATDRYTFLVRLESWDPAIFFSNDLSNFLS